MGKEKLWELVSLTDEHLEHNRKCKGKKGVSKGDIKRLNQVHTRIKALTRLWNVKST